MGAEILGVDEVARDAPPQADVDFSACLMLHLGDEEFVEMIRHVGRACRPSVILEPVWHRVALARFPSWLPGQMTKCDQLTIYGRPQGGIRDAAFC